MPEAGAVDTGLYLACSQMAARPGGAKRALTVIRRFGRRDMELFCVPEVMQEAASHTVSSLRSASRWRRDQAARFFQDFFSAVHVTLLTPLGAIRAEENYRHCRQPRRRGPSIADAATAELKHQLGLTFVVTDDAADFAALLPDYRFTTLGVGHLVRT